MNVQLEKISLEGMNRSGSEFPLTSGWIFSPQASSVGGHVQRFPESFVLCARAESPSGSKKILTLNEKCFMPQ